MSGTTLATRFLIVSVFVVLIPFAEAYAQAKAQDDTSTDDATHAILEEVIVTAERRAASLQQVPIAIMALTGDQLSNSLVNDTIELQFHVPGYVFKTNSVAGQPYIRSPIGRLFDKSANPIWTHEVRPLG